MRWFNLALLLLVPALALAQNYQCNWSVVDIGGGLMSSTSYRAMPSVGQAATGLITSTSYQCFIGFWQIDTAASGIREESHWSPTDPLRTMLYLPFPNPGLRNSGIQVRYSLASESPVSIQLFDLAGRNLHTLVNGHCRAGNYAYRLSSTVCRLSAGVCFLKMKAGDYQATRKLIIE